MKKLIAVLVVAIALVSLAVTPVLAGKGGWEEQVTGGGQAEAGGTDFSITVSARRSGEKVKGQMQYSRAGLSMHATVECLELFAEDTVAVAAGPAKAQDDPSDAVGEGDWMVVEIKEGGVGEGDRVRVRLMDSCDCADYSDSFPGYIYDGNFNIRTK